MVNGVLCSFVANYNAFGYCRFDSDILDNKIYFSSKDERPKNLNGEATYKNSCEVNKLVPDLVRGTAPFYFNNYYKSLAI